MDRAKLDHLHPDYQTDPLPPRRGHPPPPEVRIVVAHVFERALVLDWFARDANRDTSRHPLLRQPRARDAQGTDFVKRGGQWSRDGYLGPYATTVFGGDAQPEFPITLELDAGTTVELRRA